MPFTQLPFLHLIENNICIIEDQYRKIIHIDWREEPPFKNEGIPTDSESFWIGLLQHKSFKDLAKYALNCLVTPTSNAVVERIFSLVSAVKTKARNQMQLKLLDSIIRIRAELLLSNKCCKDFTPSTAMLENLTSDKVYSDGHDIDDADMELFYTN